MGGCSWRWLLLTLGESLWIPGVPAYVNRLSPVVQKGLGQGMVNAFSSIGKAIGPLFGGLVIERLGYFKLFAICTAADLIVGMMIGIVLLILRRGLQTYD
jgi:Major Facilitator Superfamily.